MSEEIIEFIKAARAKAGLTQKEVEERLGMRNLTMRDYEVGRLKLPVAIALELAKLYRVSVDELLGNIVEHNKEQERALINFKSLFNGNRLSAIFLDPILKAALEEHQEIISNHSLFDLLTFEYSERKKKELVCEIGKFLNSLAGIDGKVSSCELECVNYLLESFELQNKVKIVAQKLGEVYLPEDFPKILSRPELKHFIIWLLFFFAESDGNITYQEIDYIDKCAECLRLNRSNFLFIKEKFITEKL